MKKIFFSLFLCTQLFAQVPTPAAKQSQATLITGCTVHIGNGKLLENATVGFKDGKIILVSTASKPDYNANDFPIKINGTGKHLYPGFIALNSTLGLSEIDAVRSTIDEREVGYLNPHVRSIIAYNTDSKIIPTVRTNGVLMAQVTPRGGLISGTSSLVQLDAWNWQDAVIRNDEGMHINWPSMFSPAYYNEDGAGPMEKKKNYDKAVGELSVFFNEAMAYNKIAHPEKNIRQESMKSLFDGTQTLYIHCDRAKEITEAVMFAKKFNISKVALVGAREALLVADLIAQSNVTVIVARTHELPLYSDEDIDMPYKNAALLQKQGVRICLNNEGDMERMGARNLPFLAGTAAAYGLPKEEAVASITLNAAKILGVDKTLGSIEVGKDATLFISTGDALDMKSNNVEQAFIQGRNIDLNNFQKDLDKKYREKYKVN